MEVILPNFSVYEIEKLLLTNPDLIIEFIGQKGRGKTTHLKYFHCFFQETPLLLLSQSNKAIFLEPQELIFVDSVHHWNLKQRLAFYKRHRAIILTAHHSRKWEYFLAKKHSKTYYFKGIDLKKLTTILSNRIEQALESKEKKAILLNSLYIQKLIAYFGDDYRGILNFLYEEFQEI